MAVTENDILIKYKDSSGNLNFLYPITRKNNVDGLDEFVRDQSVTTDGSGSAYTATVEGITALSAGISFVMTPHTDSTTTAPTLNVNGLGAKYIRRRVSSSPGTTTSGASDDWLSAGKPISVLYDGTFWIADLPRPNASDIMGAVAIQNGGTGATTAAAARNALGLGNTTGALPIANGGTEATTAENARVNLGIETVDGTVTSSNADYAEVGEWTDGNPNAEDRIGYFVCVDLDNPGIIMKKATVDDDIRGVTVSAPAFSGGCSDDRFDSDGALLPKYDYVAVMGIVPVIDNGTCTVGGRCMPNSDSIAEPVEGDYGYQVMERVDDTHVLVAVEPGADFQYKAKNAISRASSPRNLLDNSDFRNPVNQRESESYSDTTQYTIDRWRTTPGIVTVNTDSISITKGETSEFALFLQYVPNCIMGNTYTFAVKKTNGEIAIVNFVASTTMDIVQTPFENTNQTANVRYTAAHETIAVGVDVLDDSSADLEWAALYEGAYTAETLPSYKPKGYAAELAECQRYFYKLAAWWKWAAYGVCTSTTTAYFTLALPQPMRVGPTVTIKDPAKVKVRCGSVASQIPSGITFDAFSASSMILLNATVSGATNGVVSALWLENPGEIEFSADL